MLFQAEEEGQCIILKAMIFGFSSGRGGVVYQAEEEGQCIKQKRRSNVSSETGGAVQWKWRCSVLSKRKGSSS